MKLRWRPKNYCEAEILGPEHSDDEDMSDVVALVCDGSSVGTGHEAANILTHRFNVHEELVADMLYAIQFLPDYYPYLTIKKRLLGGVTKAKYGVSSTLTPTQEKPDAEAEQGSRSESQ